jgi:hypothetical protein
MLLQDNRGRKAMEEEEISSKIQGIFKKYIISLTN